MVDIKSIFKEMDEDVQSVIDWCDELYDINFSSFFQGQRDLFKRLQSKTHLITDEELEWILTSIPLQLFTVAERLSQIKITQEVIKMKNKKDTIDKINESTQSTQTKKKEEAEYLMLEHKLVDTVYSSIINRVENEISFSRELIMSAKKIWDRRRQTENINPIKPIDLNEPKSVCRPHVPGTGETIIAQY